MEPFRACCRRIGKILEVRNTNENQHLPTSRCHNNNEDRMVNPDTYQPLLPATNISSSGEGDSQGDSQPQAGVNSLIPYGSM